MSIANDALRDEIEALASIYDPEVLIANDESSTAVLTLPSVAYSFILILPHAYPDEPPQIVGTHHVDASAKRGEGEAAANILRDVLEGLFTPGQVCLFDLIEEALPLLSQHHETYGQDGAAQDHESSASFRSATPPPVLFEAAESPLTAATVTTATNIPPPRWIMSDSLVVSKSTFVARCLPVSSLSEATSSISNLLSTNKKVASATHNITAWRIKTVPTQAGSPEIVIQDCDDDGETAAGGRLLHLMQLMDVWNVVVVVTRWYGGVKLGPDRFRCINAVAREALMNGGFGKVEKEKGGTAKKGKK